MQLTLLKCKIHRVTVTEADLDYTGSIAIDANLMKASGLLEHEQVDVYNITNGKRFTTYVIKAPGGSGTIGINGAAAHKASTGDLIIVVAYISMDEAEAKEHKPTLIYVDEQNHEIGDRGQVSGVG